MGRPVELLTATQISLLEVCGFDLLAQVEALLRHSREYQRDLHRLRRATTNTSVLGAVRRQIFHLRQAVTSLQRTLDVINDTGRHEGRSPAEQAALSGTTAAED